MKYISRTEAVDKSVDFVEKLWIDVDIIPHKIIRFFS